MIEMVELRAIDDAWFMLLRKKVVQGKTVYNQIYPKNLSPERLEDPDVQRQIEEKGFYEISHERSPDIIDALEYLVELGYVEKREERIYNAGWQYVAHPYLPHISVSGVVGISSKSTMPYESFTLTSSQFEAFESTAKEFKLQVDAGKHPHITKFVYGVDFSYDTVVYELKEKYFDAIYVRYSKAEDRLIIDLVEPLVESREGRDSKNWERIETIPSDKFLKGSTEIDPFVEKLEWKKKVTGILIFRDKAYWLIPAEITPELVEDEDTPWKMPNYLAGDVLSYPNYMSRIFEDATADYLRQKYGYDAYTRIKPDYLENKEIDVFGVRSVLPRQIIVCECKLRFNVSPITMTEITSFYEKILKIKENEGKRGDTIFHFWFVSNSEIYEEGVHDYAKNVGIVMMKAKLSANWEKRANWKVKSVMKTE